MDQTMSNTECCFYNKAQWEKGEGKWSYLGDVLFNWSYKKLSPKAKCRGWGLEGNVLLTKETGGAACLWVQGWLESQLVQGEPSGKWARNEGGAEKDYGLWAAGKQEYSRV